MATLSDKVKAFIVQGLATYQSPTQVSELVKNEFGIEVSRQQVATYDPTKHTGQNCAKKWKELFFETRKQYQTDYSHVAIATRTYRLEMLQKMVEKAIKSGNMVLAADLLKQAAEDIGNKYTNQSKVDNNVNMNINNLTDDELDAKIQALMNGNS